MDLQNILREAIIDELQRQAEISEGALTVAIGEDDRVTIDGPVDVEDLIAVIAGSVAGGP